MRMLVDKDVLVEGQKNPASLHFEKTFFMVIMVHELHYERNFLRSLEITLIRLIILQRISIQKLERTLRYSSYSSLGRMFENYPFRCLRAHVLSMLCTYIHHYAH